MNKLDRIVTALIERGLHDDRGDQTVEFTMEEVKAVYAPPKPTPGRIVWYQTDGRNGLEYFLPAMVTVTKGSHPGDYPDGRSNPLPVPSSDLHVHLTVFTPGGFGTEVHVASGPLPQPDDEAYKDARKLVPGSGTYVEWDVPFDPNGSRRSWRWPERS
jgi:hypothetical protein